MTKNLFPVSSVVLGLFNPRDVTGKQLHLFASFRSNLKFENTCNSETIE